MILTFFLGPIQKALNHYLQLDPETHKRLAPLAGKVVLVEAASFKCYWVFTAEEVQLATRCSRPIDLTLRGTLLNFLKLSGDSSNAAVLANDIEVVGEVKVAEHFKRLFAELDIDWEEQLAKVTGDVIAYQVANCVRTLSNWARQSMATMQENITEYVQEEARLLPNREEVQDFCANIDTLRDDSERLAARLTRLQQHMTRKESE